MKGLFAAIFLAFMFPVCASGQSVPGGSDEEILKFTDASVLQKARDGDALAQYLIGRAYVGGKLTTRDLDKALHWISLSAERGLPPALVSLARFHEQGLIVQKDEKKAFALYRRAFNAKEPISSLRIAKMFFDGRGISQSYHEAASFFRTAASRGVPAGAHYYADMLYAGKGIPEDRKEAVKWYRKAAEMGWPFAARVLAPLYFKGEFVAKDIVEASKWMHVSLALLVKKDPMTRELARKMLPHLSDTDRESGRQKAHEYLKTHIDDFKKAAVLQ
jgi:TPR repeat protein